MFCSNCGVEAGGNFCAACGSSLQTPAGNQPSPVTQASSIPQAPKSTGWADEICYERLLQHPEVRERIARAGQRSPKKMTGEEFLALFDSVVPTGVSLEKLTVALLPVWDRLGLRTGKSSELTITAPAGRALLATLCAMAAQGFELKNVDQGADGCVLTALMPSTMWTYRGELVVGVERSGRSIQIQAATKIPGQLIDWGKSKRVLSELFDEVRKELSSQQSTDPPQQRHVA